MQVAGTPTTKHIGCEGAIGPPESLSSFGQKFTFVQEVGEADQVHGIVCQIEAENFGSGGQLALDGAAEVLRVAVVLLVCALVNAVTIHDSEVRWAAAAIDWGEFLFMEGG